MRTKNIKVQGVRVPAGIDAALEMKEKVKPVASALNESSILERALLGRLGVSRWYGSGADESVVHELRSAKGATGEIGSFTKRLMKRDRLAGVNRVTAEARKYWKLMTMPWGDSGQRLLPVEVFLEVKHRMTDYEQRFWIEVNEFLKGYESFVEDEKKNLGALWKQSDYPSVADMRSNFGFGLAIDPLPDASDLRVKLSKEQAGEIKKEVEERLHSSVQAAVGDLYARIGEEVASAKEKLDAADPKLRSTMFGGLQAVLTLLPRLNLLQDPKLTALGQKVQAELLSVDVGSLKDSATVRSAVSKKAEGILNSIAALQKGNK